MENIILSTPRLELVQLSIDNLKSYLEDEYTFNREVGPTSRNILTDTLRGAIEMKLSKLSAARLEDHPWITYWLIKALPDRYGAGMLGFKGIPNDEGEVEIGYGIDPEFRNQGFTTEAVSRLILWAFNDPRCRRIIAPDTQRSNLSSNRLLEKVGMRIYSESEHTISWSLEKGVGGQEL